eukprot:scaffold96887_cov20-Prasinocladus_malaysianus.AAC.1
MGIEDMSPGCVYPSLIGNSSSQKTGWHRHDSVTRIYVPIECDSGEHCLTWADSPEGFNFVDAPIDSAKLREKIGLSLSHVSQDLLLLMYPAICTAHAQLSPVDILLCNIYDYSASLKINLIPRSICSRTRRSNRAVSCKTDVRICIDEAGKIVVNR